MWEQDILEWVWSSNISRRETLPGSLYNKMCVKCWFNIYSFQFIKCFLGSVARPTKEDKLRELGLEGSLSYEILCERSESQCFMMQGTGCLISPATAAPSFLPSIHSQSNINSLFFSMHATTPTLSAVVCWSLKVNVICVPLELMWIHVLITLMSFQASFGLSSKTQLINLLLK